MVDAHDGPSPDGGWFGVWGVDGAGMACFDVAMAPWRSGAPALILPEPGYDDLWHQVASADVTATAHVGGWTTLYEGRRGVVRLTGRRSWWGAPEDPIGWSGRRPAATRWGRGYAEWRARSGPWEVVRRVSAPRGAGAALRVDVTLDRAELARDGAGRLSDRYAEAWVPQALPLLVGALMSPTVPPPPGTGGRDALVWRGLYGASAVVRSLTWAARASVAPALQHRSTSRPGDRAVVTAPRWPRRAGDPTTPAWVDLRLPVVAVALAAATLDGVDALDSIDVTGDGPILAVSLPPEASRVVLTFVVALPDRASDLPGLRDAVVRATPEEAARRQRALDPVSVPDRPVLTREAGWHATYLAGAEQADDVFAARYPSQGSAYGYVHGLQGAPRDYAISAVALAPIAADAAADALRVIMRMTTRDGTIQYAHTGRGRVTSGGIHAAPTDLPLFLLWALTEYVDTTGDRAFLTEAVPYLSRRSGAAATPLERAVQALTVLAERIGTGPHGMLRVGSGDWADPISAMVPDRGAFHERGESGFNTTMACHVLPRAADLVASSAPEAAADARRLAGRLREAMAAGWAGEWFLRGWDGRGGPVGDRHLFLDGQVWALIARVGTDAQRAVLVDAIRDRCLDPSPVGATILDRPHPVRFGMLAPGWDCNGGVWAAINGLLAWGLAGHDADLAWRCLEAQSLAAHARAYPHVWFGVWSGPDAYNAHFGSRPGETFVQPATPMQEFPVMNSNAHAGPLLGLHKVRTLLASPAPGSSKGSER